MEIYITQVGQGLVTATDAGFRLHVPSASASDYHNAQISSYRTRQEFTHNPPLRLTMRARAEGELRGTAGFGFWNHAFAPKERYFRVPKAVWFFHASLPSNMALAKGVPGHGWKAATFDAAQRRFYALAPATPVGFWLMRIPALYKRLWGIGQRAIGVSEHLLDSNLLYDWHTYTLEWRAHSVTFAVDGAIIHQTDRSPRGRLGFVAWVDNQYAIVTPQGKFGFGLVDAPQPQTLELQNLLIESIRS